MNKSVFREFTADDFLPLHKRAEMVEPLRPSWSFWQTVFRRLVKNLRAWFAISIIFLMTVAILVGPLVWSQSPSSQWLGSVSAAPSISQRVPVWIKSAASLENPKEFIVAQATTEAVELYWPAVANAIAYRIYRHDHAPKNNVDLGIPLAELSATQFAYTDGLNLRSQAYWYSLVTITTSKSSAENQIIMTQSVAPIAVIDFMQAQLQGLIPLGANPAQWIDKTVEIPAHPLGTDALGRDLLARLIEGGRTSLFIGIFAPCIFVLFGALYGATAALLGGRWDNLMMRFTDFVVALPFLLFMILIRVAAGIQSGESGVLPMLVALVLLSWPTAARLVRAQVLQLKHEPYIQSARLSGASTFYLVRRHLLPNVLAVILVTLSFAIPQAIFVEAFLSFIGMGVTPPTASWGSLCQEGLKTMLLYPRELLWPAACIAMTVLAFNLLGDALRDALDWRVESPT
jgi:oligopeptide transport system permease protein